MNPQTLFLMYGVLFGLMGTIFIGMIVAMIIFVRKINRMRKNPIDITIFEFFKDSFRIREEIGRYDFSDIHGKILITTDKKGKMKDNLGNKISENFLLPKTSVGFKQVLYGTRKCINVGIKDTIPAPIYPVSEEKKYTAHELETVKKYNAILPELSKIEKSIFPMPITENPLTFSLKPILAEQTKFVLDVNRELQANFKMDEWNELMKKLIRMFVPMIIIFLIVVMVIFIFLIFYGKNIAEIGKIATTAKAVQTVPAYYQVLANATKLPV